MLGNVRDRFLSWCHGPLGFQGLQKRRIFALQLGYLQTVRGGSASQSFHDAIDLLLASSTTNGSMNLVELAGGVANGVGLHGEVVCALS